MLTEIDGFVRREVVLAFHRAVWTSHCDVTANVVGVRAAARTTLSETQPRPTGTRSRSNTVSETATPTASYLTQEAFDRLKSELDQMSGEGRTEIAKKIEAARDEGDLKENGGYHAAKEEQGKMEARIRQLTQLLENAIVGAKPADDGIVEPGMVVTVEMFGDDVTFLLGSREIAGDSDLEVYSEKSPLGAAINGKKVGDKASYKAPNGKVIQVSVKGATPHGG
jgi:transcription elongation factor GreA